MVLTSYSSHDVIHVRTCKLEETVFNACFPIELGLLAVKPLYCPCIYKTNMHRKTPISIVTSPGSGHKRHRGYGKSTQERRY